MATTVEAPFPRAAGRHLPAVSWTPSDNEPPYPVVLIGHGGSGHKRAHRVVDHARAFAAAGVATIALDGPFHGDRVTEPLSTFDYRARIAAEGADNVVDRMTSDWSAVLDVVDAVGELDGRRIGYLGLSMGTRYGLPLLAAHGDRFTAAVLGKFGLTQIPPPPPELDLSTRVRADAAVTRVPLLFHIQLDDELFGVDGQRELAGLLGSPDKRLLTRPGRHGETHPDDQAAWRRFLIERLTGATPQS